MDMPCHAMVAEAVAEMHHVLIASIVSSSTSINPYYVKIDSIVISALSTFTLCHTIQHIIHHFRMYKRIQIRPNQIRKKENSFLSVIGRSSLLKHAHKNSFSNVVKWTEVSGDVCMSESLHSPEFFPHFVNVVVAVLCPFVPPHNTDIIVWHAIYFCIVWCDEKHNSLLFGYHNDKN